MGSQQPIRCGPWPSTQAGKAPAEADALVIFGITGDLAKKMTYDALYDLEQRGTLKVPVIGVAIDDLSKEDLVKRMRESCEAAEKDLDDEVFKRLADRVTYIQGDYKDPKTFEAVGEGAERGRASRLLPGDPALPVRAGRRRARPRRS